MRTPKNNSVQRRARTTRWLLVPLAVGALGACNDFDLVPYEGGYPPVANRQEGGLPGFSNPAPPPVTGPIGGGAAEVPVLAAAATPPGVTQAMVEEGAELYGTVCSACHGPGGAGTPAAPALVDDEWINISGSFDEIVSLIHAGVPSPRQFAGAMPPLGGGNFNDEQVRAIAAYVFALSHAEEGA